MPVETAKTLSKKAGFPFFPHDFPPLYHTISFLSSFQMCFRYLISLLVQNAWSCTISRYLLPYLKMDTNAGRRLLELRRALGLTQQAFGAKIHISRGYVTSLEKNRQPLNGRIVKLIADTFGVNSEWLKTGSGEMFLDLKNIQLMETISIFNQLNPDFQNFIISQLKQLLEMNHNYQGGKK
ncbi:MAG: helix-turn-helix transcriptional regulator [Treponema sp.]|nr:helix-turn-helix transcriptional regulator [Treponema sp.]